MAFVSLDRQVFHRGQYVDVSTCYFEGGKLDGLDVVPVMLIFRKQVQPSDIYVSLEHITSECGVRPDNHPVE
jgi:hypothetical protein